MEIKISCASPMPWNTLEADCLSLPHIGWRLHSRETKTAQLIWQWGVILGLQILKKGVCGARVLADANSPRKKACHCTRRNHCTRRLQRLQALTQTKSMATLAQPSPKSPRKPISVRDKWRQKTNYKSKRFTGFAPISFAMVAEVGRLTTGKTTQLLYVILTAALGQMVGATEEFNERACDLRTVDLAELTGCDQHSTTRDLGELARRKVILWDQPKKGVNNVTPLFRSWASLPDYTAGPVAEPKEDKSEDKAKSQGEITNLTSKPVYVGAGKTSRPIKVACEVESISFNMQALDGHFSAVLQGGRLLVTAEPKWKSSDGVSGLVKQKEIAEKPRQGCRIFEDSKKRTEGEKRIESEQLAGGQSSQKGAGVQSKGTSPVQHPRSEELSSLFDPLLLKSCNKSLSADHVALLGACEAIADTPHDFLVKVVIERASRAISSPRAAVAIVREVAANWQKVKDMPASAKPITREEMDAMVAKDRAARLAKQRRTA